MHLSVSHLYKGLLIAFLMHFSISAMSQNGYDLWLNYRSIEDEKRVEELGLLLDNIYISPDLNNKKIIQDELTHAVSGWLNSSWQPCQMDDANLIVSPVSELIDLLSSKQIDKINSLNQEGYAIIKNDNQPLIITANNSKGLLYGSFRLIEEIQVGNNLANLSIWDEPAIQLRMLNHWDNLDRSSERGYAGFSIWDWHRLPEYIDPRYIDYARANASIGINGTVLTNVNANAEVLTEPFLKKVKVLADVFRPYGIKVFLTARFSAPIELGGLTTADPIQEEVTAWWSEKAAEIYQIIPDFGGFVVKANSEGQPGPQNYGRTHAEGANMLATAIAPYGGLVMWRAFVYSNEEPEDRAKQAYNEFMPLDGSFNENVLIQVKNGPIDFQPREPFHPLFGAMKKTPLVMEFQITQEYLGQATHWVYLGPMYEEVLQSATKVAKTARVSDLIQGSVYPQKLTAIAGVANIGSAMNWTGHPMAQANWYVFGKLAWNPDASTENIGKEWVQRTLGKEKKVVETVPKIMQSSWLNTINYMTPLGLHHLMGTSHHYGPAPWINNLSRGDWNPVYYHKSDRNGIGFDRTVTGSNALEQYHPKRAQLWNDPKTCPTELLLWFHHLPWDYKLDNQRILWDELAYSYQSGIDGVRQMQQQWGSLEDFIEPWLFDNVNQLLSRQEKEAVWWKDACLLYFQTFSKLPFPDGVEPPLHDLDFYKELNFTYAPGIRLEW